MESEVRIKAKISEIYKEFQENEVYSIRNYEPLYGEDKDRAVKEDEPIVFLVRIRHRELAKKLQNRIYTLKGLENAILSAPTEKPRVELLKVLSYTIPTYGNKRLFPYATLKIRNSKGEIKTVKTLEEDGRTFIRVDGFEYVIKNKGSLYSPILEISDY